MDKLLTVEEFALKMNIKYRQVLRLIASDKITAVNICNGNRSIYRILQSELDRFLAEQYEMKL